ncbi:MAG: hypothetical protein LUF04_06840 [Bacteroides sp.]|nr:hypothetical protein [Bacteroides sp.]
MSVELHPDIRNLDPESLCASIYPQLYQNFLNSQDKGSVEEGDAVSIRPHNAAYGFAEAIAAEVTQEETGGRLLLDYLKRSSGDIQGLLRANNGFEAGIKDQSLLSKYQWEGPDQQEESGVEINGVLRIGGNDLRIGGERVLSYDRQRETAVLAGKNLSMECATITSRGEWLIGEKRETGVYEGVSY